MSEETNVRHTPGPWRIDDTNGYGDLFIAAAGERNALCIALIEHPSPLGHGVPEVLANANLIAAAPDLLAVCQRVAEVFEGTDSTLNIAARAAIAKATERDAL